MHSAHCTHAHIHTQMHAHTRAHAFTHAYILIHAYTHNLAHKRLHSHTRACNLNTQADIQICSYMWTCTSVYNLSHTLIETIQHWAPTCLCSVHRLMHTHINYPTYAHSHLHSLSHICTPTYTFIHAFPYTQLNAVIHTHFSTHIHTCTNHSNE